jgi:DNA-binding response OmpR family regulator
MSNGLRVLVAEDDPLLLAMYGEILLALGYTPILAATGKEAWHVLEYDPPPLVILDLLMPDIGGLELCRRLRATHPHATAASTAPDGNSGLETGESPQETFVLVVTARDDGNVLTEVLDAGADDFLAKPVSAEQLAARLTIALRNLAQRRARLRAEEEAANAKWLAGIGATSLALQHEINNPLTAILGNAALLWTGEYPKDEEREFVQTISEQAHRISDVVRRLSSLKNPKTVQYIAGARMLDLSEEETEGTGNPGESPNGSGAF